MEAGAVKELTPEEVSKELEKLQGSEKTAILLIALGMEAATKILPLLGDREVERVSIAIARYRNVPSALVEAVLVDFHDLTMGRDFVTQGGLDFARQTLREALGPRRAEEILMRVEAAMEVSAFHLLQTLETTQLTNFLQGEHPQTSALILAHLNAHKAAAIIGQLPPAQQSDIVYRLATMGKTSPELLSDIEEVIRQQIGSVIGSQLSNTGGIEKVVEILNKTSRTAEKTIMDAIRDRDDELANNIKALMFVFDDLVHVSDRDMQRILVEVEQRDLILALKGVSEDMKDKLLGNVSERASAIIKEELEMMGPARVRDVEEAQRRILEVVQTLEEQEEITISRSESDAFL